MNGEYLEPRRAIELMLDGEVLKHYDQDVWFAGICFMCGKKGIMGSAGVVTDFYKLRRKPQKTRRKMTNYECLLWAQDAKGWVVRSGDYASWKLPQHYAYSASDLSLLRRAKLLPDGSGIDESTITDFTVEVEQ